MKHVKYPRTPRLDRSLSRTSDDVGFGASLDGVEVVITEKMDGENTSLYRDGWHARSLDSGKHGSRDQVAALWADVCSRIPSGCKLVVEYTLPHFAYGIMVMDEWVWPWSQSSELFEQLGIPTVPVLWTGVYSESVIDELIESLDPSTQEGFVVRPTGGFPVSHFGSCVAKYVRAPNSITGRI